jgi:hypothetical protein
MPVRDAAGMGLRSPTWVECRRLLMAGLFGVAIVGLAMPSRPQVPSAASPQLLRWTDQDHDWLLVADRLRDRVAIYDATDGRPLGMLDHDDGLGDVESMVLEGRWLVVLGTGEPRVVRLPDLRTQPLALVVR